MPTHALSVPQPDTFSALIRQKEYLLERLVPISQKQIEFVRRADSDELLRFLQRKMAVMDEFEDLERRLTPFKDISPEDRIWIDEKDREETRKTMKRCEMLLAEIVANDEISTAELASMTEEIQQQLKSIRQNGKQNSYAMQNAVETPNLRRLNIDG